MVKYAYDAYGNCSIVYGSSHDLARRNPIRYRGYYYDRETNLYYLNARYYNPEWRRFISPDSPSSLDPKSVNGLNLYAYCRNNPVISSVGSNSIAIKNTVNAFVSSDVIRNIAVGASIAIDLGLLSNLYAHNDNVFSIVSGIVEAARRNQGLTQIEALSKTGKILMHVGYVINIGISAYENYHDDSMTKQEKWVSFLVDANHITGQAIGGYFLSTIPYAGPFLAVGVPITVDYFWSGELCILGFEIKRVSKPYIYGKTSEEWVKYWINSLLE